MTFDLSPARQIDPRPPTNGRTSGNVSTPIAGRVAPHSPEAEEYLLSCCLLDGSDSIARCLEDQLPSTTFFVPANRLIYEKLCAIYAKNPPVDLALLAEELKASHQLEEVGGYSYLTQISSHVPTTVQLGFFIDRLRDLATRREIINAASSTLEKCFNGTAPLEDLLTGLRSRCDTAAAIAGMGPILARLEAVKYDQGRRLPEAQPVFHLGATPIATRGNIITLTAQSKVGKSSALAAMMASTFGADDADTFKIHGKNTAGQALIHFDTEQPGKRHERLMDTVLQRARVDILPAWLHSYPRKGTPAPELRRELEAIIASKNVKHGGVHAVMVDGVADLIVDPNSAEECFPVVTWLESLAVKYNTAVVCVLHLNPTSARDSVAKARGHLGSQLQRKAETDLRLVKDSANITTIYTDLQGTRGEPVFEKDGPRFSWDVKAGMHLSLESKAVSKDAEKAARLRELADEIWAEDKGLRYTEIVTRLKAKCRVKDSGAEEKFSDMKKLGVIKKEFSQWTLTP